jgi:hypothetical protein
MIIKYKIEYNLYETVLSESLTVAQLVKKLPVSKATRLLNIMHTRVHHLFLS